MIDVKNTILETIKDKIQKMRFLGQYDPLTFKHILYLIILDDIYDWSNYLDDNLSVQKRLQELRTLFILNHGEFVTQISNPNNFYVNVNTPQTNYTWKRVWDAPDVKPIDSVEQITGTTINEKPFIPDPTCPVSLTYYGGIGDIILPDINGKPSVDFDTLTICEKMNIYINRDQNSEHFGKMFFINPDTCKWESVKGDLVSTIKWNDIDGRPTVYQGIQHSLGDESLTTELLTEGSSSTSIDIAGEDEIDDVL